MNRLDLPEYAEDAAILRFYHLDSLEPEVWVDDEHHHDHDHEEKESIQQFHHPEQDDMTNQTTIRPSETDIDLQVIDDSDPLGVYASIFPDDMSRNKNISQLKEKATMMITNNKFQPRHFLLQVHKDTSYNDLVDGEERLRRGVDQRAEAQKDLVHQNFDRFVSAKNTIDHVYEEMKSKQLNKEQEYGTVGIQKALDAANTRAEQVYGPVVERRQRAEKVRSTLYILQRYRFLFNLPSSLLESIKQTKYEAAIRDYKKGKYLYQVLKGDLDASDKNALPDLDNNETGITDLHHKVFDKVWAEVSKIVIELQNVLRRMLTDPWRSMDDQEKTINFLFDLDTTEDPAWYYLDSQYQWIMGLMKETYDTSIKKVNRLKEENETEESAIKRSLALKKAIKQIQTKSSDLNDSSELRVWQAISDLVKSQSSLLLRCLPDFWRLSKAFIEGKFANKAAAVSSTGPMGVASNTRRRRIGMDMNKVEQCQRMTRDIIDQYASLISDYFSLNETHLQTKKNIDGSEKHIMPSFVPVNVNSISTSEYLTLIISDLASCVNDINAIQLAGEAFSGLTELMEKTRNKFIDVLCKCWERDAKTFYMLEEWILDPQNPQITTLLKRYYDYHKYCARSAYKIASLSAVTSDRQERKISPEYIDKIRGSFLESTYTFLDGLVQLAFTDYTPLNEKDELLLSKKREKINVHSMDVRILLTVSNLDHMRGNVMRKLMDLFESAYHVNMEEDLHTLVDVVDQLDEILFGDYIKRKSQMIRDIVRQGILMSGIDWSSIPKPQEVHPFVYEALMTLVMVHSQISSVTKQLVSRALSKLLETMASDCLDSFRQVERFGMGGMLQATLEIEFMHQTLSQYVTPAASDTLQSIYQTIEQAYDPQQQQSSSLQSELSHVKELLVFSRKSTVVQFLCFKQNKDRRKTTIAK